MVRMARTKRQQLESALALWTMYQRGAMRASDKQMRDLDAKIARLAAEIQQLAELEGSDAK